jgi:phospholipid/cholesterol/gamma-HCH transport system substrate-binding protein
MEARREQVFVGLFVIVAAALLVATVFALSGVFASSTRTYHAKFHNAAGLDQGATVRYQGGTKIGRVEKLRIDPADPSMMDMEFSVKSDLPIKTDSRVSILSFSPLGDNHLEVSSGSPNAPRAPNGALLPSDPYVGFNELEAQINKLAPQAQELLANLNDRVTQLKVTIDRVNEVLNDKNRENLSETLAEVHGMLKENRPQIKNTLNNVNDASAKLSPLLDQIHKTVDQADGTLKKIDGMLDENRGNIKVTVEKARESLEHISVLTGQLQSLLADNDYNIEELLNNMRIISENLKQFTDTIKTRPATLINSHGPRDRRPGDKP